MSIIDDKIRDSRIVFGDGIEPGCVCVTCEISRFRDALEVAVKALRGEWMTLDAYNEIERILNCETLAKGAG